MRRITVTAELGSTFAYFTVHDTDSSGNGRGETGATIRTLESKYGLTPTELEWVRRLRFNESMVIKRPAAPTPNVRSLLKRVQCFCPVDVQAEIDAALLSLGTDPTPTTHPHGAALAALEREAGLSLGTESDAVSALRDLREAICLHDGHGMPGFTDRAVAYIVIQRADAVLRGAPAPTYLVNLESEHSSLRSFTVRDEAGGFIVQGVGIRSLTARLGLHQDEVERLMNMAPGSSTSTRCSVEPHEAMRGYGDGSGFTYGVSDVKGTPGETS
jgi:hypothetical protein